MSVFLMLFIVVAVVVDDNYVVAELLCFFTFMHGYRMKQM